MNAPVIFDGLLWDGSLVQVPGARVASPAQHPQLALSSYDSRARGEHEAIDLGVGHNIHGNWPLKILPGYGPEEDNTAERVALSWRNDDRREKPRYAGTQLIVSFGGQRVLCLADCKRRVGYGAGHKRANGNGINLEIAGHVAPNGGTILYQGAIDTAAAVFDHLATLAGWPREAAAPRPRGRELIRALADVKSKIRGVADHCSFTRNRGLGDNGYVIPLALQKLFGWKLVDWDAITVAPAWPEPPPSWLAGPGVVEVLPGTQTSGGQLELAELVAAALRLGRSIDQALELGAHAATESGWALKDVAFNWWGWKHKKTFADEDRARGHKVLFWRRAGHPGAGDPEVCYYRGFESAEDSLRAFLPHFCPKPGTRERESSAGRYRVAGEAFWSGHPESWFAEIIAAGYRGDRTADDPEESLVEHLRLVDEVGGCWAQLALGLEVDGAWGPKSRAALNARVGSELPTPEALRTLAHGPPA